VISYWQTAKVQNTGEIIPISLIRWRTSMDQNLKRYSNTI